MYTLYPQRAYNSIFACDKGSEHVCDKGSGHVTIDALPAKKLGFCVIMVSEIGGHDG